MSRPQSSTMPPLRAYAAAFGIALLGLWIYWPALHGSWLWDDESLIRDNLMLRDWGGLWKIWFQPGQLDYFPLTTSAQWALWHLGGGSVIPFHLANVALHIGSGLLLWRLLTLLGVRHGWIGALLWVAHPMAVESVAWMAEMKNTLSQFLVLLSLVLYACRPQSHALSRPWYASSLLFFIAALLSKSSVVMLPFVLLLYAWWKHGRIRRADFLASLPFFAAALAAGLLTVWFQHTRGIGEEYIAIGGAGARLARAGLAVVFYFYQAVFPAEVMFIYPRWDVDPPSPVQFLPWIGLAAVLWWCWRKRAGWGRHTLLGLGFFLLNLVPVLGFVTMAYMWITWAADHFAYLSLAGVVGLAAAGVSAFWLRAGKFRPAAAAAFTLVAVLLAWQSHDYAAAFQNPMALFTRAARSNPGSWHAHRMLANMFAENNQPAKAAEHLEAAVRIQQAAIQAHPDDPVAHYQLGLLRRQQNHPLDALAAFEEALRLKPDYVGAHGNAGFILFLSGRIPEARRHFLEALETGPDSAEIRYNLGYVYMSESNPVEALPHLEQAVKLKGDYPEAHFLLAQTYQQLRRPADALRELEATLRLQPDNQSLRQLVEQFKRDGNR